MSTTTTLPKTPDMAPASSGPHPNVIIRHARNALHLLISGALRDIEAGTTDTTSPTTEEAIRDLFDGLHNQMDQWDVDGTEQTRTANLVQELQAEIGPDARIHIGELLQKHDLLP
jgi:hypothetical protein